MNTARTRLAVADLTATLSTEFDVPALLHAVARHALRCFDAHSAAVVLHGRRAAGNAGLHIVAEAARDATPTDPLLHTIGPATASARDGAVAMIADLDDPAAGDRWPEYRARARESGLRSVRAFPVKAMGVPLGAVIVHADEPWGTQRPNDFGQILADLTAIALSTSQGGARRVTTTDTVDTVLDGTAVIATAVGVLAEYFDRDVEAARLRLHRLARAHQRTPTAQATAVVRAQQLSPADPGAEPALHLPPDLAPPTSIGR
ncbi:GAF domain-containing protein [Nocardia neocaledoniensis]|uniref:GAF domain-containing protein n=1 Tax=Nocardia neocaledoniensis TaxID=236511 RepID=UPI0024577222|nr:GAF domain-containing protein [Nocardia neocaledoniensis]